MKTLAVILLIVGAGALPAHSATFTIQPDSKDGFTYSGDGLDGITASTLAGLYPGMLAISTTGVIDGSTHDSNSYLQFDLSSLPAGAHVTSAYLELQGISAATVGYGADPTAGNPLSAGVYALGASWDPSTLSYDVSPATVGGLLDTQSITGPNQLTSFNVTSVVQQWLSNSLTNNGLEITQLSPTDGSAVGVFNGGAAGSGQPLLVVNTAAIATPEPSTVALALVGLVAFGLKRWSNRRGQQSYRSVE